MNSREPAPWVQRHDFHTADAGAERGTRAVMWITAATMVAEIAAGWWFGSMALLADGWHMSSHALAIGLSAFAYAASRRYAGDPRFAFGTWKLEILAGFASAIALLGVAALMIVGSVERLLAPRPILYREALLVATLGLIVNIVCALILSRAHGPHRHAGAHAEAGTHHHEHGHGHGHGHGHRPAGHGRHAHAEPHGHGHGHADLNLRSAYLHVIADAATSALAMVALAGGWLFGWSWLDPAMGLVGAVLVATWARGLLMQTGKALLDREMDDPVVGKIRASIEGSGRERIVDLHVWRVGGQAYACVLTVASLDRTFDACEARHRLELHHEVAHTTVEVHHVERLPSA